MLVEDPAQQLLQMAELATSEEPIVVDADAYMAWLETGVGSDPCGEGAFIRPPGPAAS